MTITFTASRVRQAFAACGVGLLLTGCHHEPPTPPAALAHPAAVNMPAVIAKPAISRPIQAYGFVHHETTGITSYIIVDGKEVAIQFRNDSSQREIKLLYALKPGIFLYNTAGKNIFLIGQLYDGINHAPSAPNVATSQVYHEFTLRQWYIVTPFRDCVNFERVEKSLGDEKERFISRSSLTRSDFNNFPGLDHLNTKTLVQKR